MEKDKVKDEYMVKADSRGRVHLKDFPTNYCTVRHYSDGRIVVIPKKLVDYTPGITESVDKYMEDRNNV